MIDATTPPDIEMRMSGLWVNYDMRGNASP
jgi:hypothetical protein